MPGLRSLVARRRCSLPSTHVISSETVVCSYPAIPGAISSRKRNSLDEIGKEGSENDHSKWDLKTLFEIEEDSVGSAKPDSGLHNELYACPSNKTGQVNGGTSLSISEKENSSLTHCPKGSFEAPLKQEMIQDAFLPSNELERNFENDKELPSSQIPPERIVIKMKLLHGNSLSDVTNIAADSSEGNDNIKRSDVNYDSGNTSKSKTRWTIDSILNQPVDSLKLENGLSHENKVKVNATEATENKPSLLVNNNGSSKRFSDDSEVKKQSFSLNEVNLNCNGIDSFIPNRDTTNWPNHSNSLHNGGTNNCSVKEELKHCTSSFKSISGFIDSIRRPSNSSDTSEDSILSEASTVSSHSSSSSGSSVKSCSIVIKRLENSDSYSCFRSPKTKGKRCRKINLSRAVYLKNRKSSLPLLYIPKRLLYNPPSNILPCSVTLCDIFSNYPFTKELCPRCFNFYNLPKDVFVNIISSTITLQCLTCKWLVVRTLRSKEINIYTEAKYHCH